MPPETLNAEVRSLDKDIRQELTVSFRDKSTTSATVAAVVANENFQMGWHNRPNNRFVDHPRDICPQARDLNKISAAMLRPAGIESVSMPLTEFAELRLATWTCTPAPKYPPVTVTVIPPGLERTPDTGIVSGPLKVLAIRIS